MVLRDRYVAPARWLHWTVAALVLVMLGLGLWIDYGHPGDALYEWLDWLHQGTGTVVFVLVLLRLLVRLSNGAPPLPADTPDSVRMAAGLNHFAFYALLLIQPVIGFLYTNSQGFPLTWFSLVPIPSPLGKNKAAETILGALHWYIAAALIVLIAMHLAGVLYHTTIRRDHLLRRML
jgi:cytochrome b561